MIIKTRTIVINTISTRAVITEKITRNHHKSINIITIIKEGITRTIIIIEAIIIQIDIIITVITITMVKGTIIITITEITTIMLQVQVVVEVDKERIIIVTPIETIMIITTPIIIEIAETISIMITTITGIIKTEEITINSLKKMKKSKKN